MHIEETKKYVKSALIGPILPFRGGIAQHTTMLHRALSELAEVMTISFSRQYPAMIFPGESDRDPSLAGYKERGVEYLIDSLNPLTWRSTVAWVLAFKPDVVVIPWWTVYWSFCFGYIARALNKKGIPVVFLCHNVVEHESSWWKSALTRMALGQGSRFLVHTREDEANLRRLFPKAEIRIHAMPIFDQFPGPKRMLPKRGALEMLFYGFVRPYKGLDVLIEAMAQTADDVYLTIAGEFWEGKEQISQRIEALGLTHRVELHPRYHTDEETAELFARCDVVVLPYRSATGSGVVPLAYHYDKPVIVSRIGGLPDVVHHNETGVLVDPENIDALAEAINSMTRARAEAMVPAIQALKSTMTWSSLAAALLDGSGSAPSLPAD